MFLDILGNMDSDEGTIEINPELFLWAQSLNQIGIDAALSNINFVPDMRTRIAAGASIFLKNMMLEAKKLHRKSNNPQKRGTRQDILQSHGFLLCGTNHPKSKKRKLKTSPSSLNIEISDLPLDLMLQIFSYMQSMYWQSDLYSCSLVCRDWTSLACPLLWRNPRLKSVDQTRKLVMSCIFHPSRQSGCSRWIRSLILPRHHWTNEELFLLRVLSENDYLYNIHRLCLPAPRLPSLQEGLFSMSEHILLPIIIPMKDSLEELSISRLRRVDLPSLGKTLSSWSSLKRLRLSVDPDEVDNLPLDLEEPSKERETFIVSKNKDDPHSSTRGLGSSLTSLILDNGGPCIPATEIVKVVKASSGNLTTLVLSHCFSVTFDTLVACLKLCPSLETLILLSLDLELSNSFSLAHYQTKACLPIMHELKTFIMGGCSIFHEKMDWLGRCSPNLEVLMLDSIFAVPDTSTDSTSNSNFNACLLSSFASSTSRLKILNLRNNDHITCRNLVSLFEANPNIFAVDLSHENPLSNDNTDLILRKRSSSCNPLTQIFSKFGSTLAVIDLRGILSVDDHLIKILAENTRHHLKSLAIGGTSATDEGILILPQFCINLEELDISQCQGITKYGIENLLSQLMRLRIFWHFGDPSGITVDGQILSQDNLNQSPVRSSFLPPVQSANDNVEEEIEESLHRFPDNDEENTIPSISISNIPDEQSIPDSSGDSDTDTQTDQTPSTSSLEDELDGLDAATAEYSAYDPFDLSNSVGGFPLIQEFPPGRLLTQVAFGGDEVFFWECFFDGFEYQIPTGYSSAAPLKGKNPIGSSSNF